MYLSYCAQAPHAAADSSMLTKGGARVGLQVKTRSQVAAAEKVDKFKMNRAKGKLKHMLEEYGQRGKLQVPILKNHLTYSI